MKYGEEIRNFIINNVCFVNDVINKFSISKEHLNLFLNKNEDLKIKLKQDSNLNLKNLAKINGRKSSLNLKGKEKKPITEEMKNRFIELKNKGNFKWNIRRILQKEFGLGEKKYYQLCKLYGLPKENPQSGKLNPMYGKSPSLKSGIGIKSRIIMGGHNLFCRSSLELKIYLYLIENKINLIQSKHRIKYDFDGKERTYNPDIVVGCEIFEIKPEKMKNLLINKLKNDAISRYCDYYKIKYGGFITENTFDLSKYRDLKYIEKLVDSGNIIIDEKNLEKLKRYYE